MSSPLVRSRVVCHGAVQGVFFRDTCRRAAKKYGLTGWVRNRPDGTVEAAFEGAPGAVEAMLRWCETGPPLARVSRVEVTEEPVRGSTTFEVRG
jgi:acylphosphatase